MKANIIYNNELCDIIKKFYLRECTEVEVADIYYKYKLYSAATSYYTIAIDSKLNQIDDKFKSYCFCQMAKCYYYQQLDREWSPWQLDTIHHLCKEAIAYDYTNIKAHMILSEAYERLDQVKNGYYEAEFVINNLDLYEVESKQDIIDIIEFCKHFFDLAEAHFVIKYEDMFIKIINYLSNNDYFNYDMIKDVMERIDKHRAILNNDAEQTNIFGKNFY